MRNLVLKSGDPDNSHVLERRFYIDCDSDVNYYIGLVVTVKNQKRFCKLQDDGGGAVKISVANLIGNDKLMEFNFFVLNKNNGIGLYQHYHQSCSLNSFGDYLKAYFRQCRDSMIAAEVEMIKLNNGEVTDAEEKSVRKKYKGGLKFSQLVRKESLAIILSEFKKLKAFEYELSTLDAEIDDAVPLKPYLRKVREKLTFAPQWTCAALAKPIIDLIEKVKPSRGRVYAKNEVGEDVVLAIFNMPDNFGEENYDDVAAKLDNLDLSKIGEHRVPKELIALCRSDEVRHIFEAEVA